MNLSQQSFRFTTASAPPSRRNLVIEAGAGTGKTTAIVAEVLKLMVADPDLAPERIVLVTFTEKAAGEIADRIRGALEELHAHMGDARVVWPIGSPRPLVEITDRDAAKRAIAKHLERIDALRSQTIHSFCQSLLRSFPIEAGLDPQFKIIEGFERSLLYGQLYDAWIDRETRIDVDPEHVREWELLFAHVGYLFAIRDLVFALVERRDLLHETAYDFGDFSLVRDPLGDAVAWIRRDPSVRVKDDAANDVIAYLGRNTPRAETADAWIDYLQPIAARIREIDLRYCGSLKEPMQVLRSGDKGDSIYDRLVSDRAAMALLSLTRRFVDSLDAEKRKLGVVDFDDLLLRTAALLEDATVLQRVRAQFDYLFVDEFQDTDRTQARIIDKLARDSFGGFVPGRTIVVGDPKQSIYAFRRADPETYDAMTRALERGGAEVRRLEGNYRSDAPLLAAINAMFACLFPERERDPNVFRPAYTPLVAGKGDGARALDARITLLQVEHEEKSDRYIREAEAIAEVIRARRDGSEGDLQRFAVLFRRLTKLDDYLDTLDRYDIPYVLPPTRLFLDRRAPVDLLAVLRAVAYPFDKGAQISAARTPYFALTDDEIAVGVSGGGAAWQSFASIIEQYRELAHHCTVSQLIDRVVATSGIEHVYDAAADGIRHKRHLEHLRSIAFEYDHSTGGSVRQFVDEISRRRTEPDEMEPSLVDEAKNAVRILSVHAAKGLEFDSVILPDLSFPSRSQEATQLFTVEEPRRMALAGRVESLSANFALTAKKETLKDVAGEREEAEMDRLFYVAVTRAKCEVLFVCNTSKGFKVEGFLKCLALTLGLDRNGLAALWNGDEREVREVPIGGVAIPVAFAKHATHDTHASATRHRLVDTSLERELATSPIVPLDLPTPPPAPRALAAADVARERAGARNRAAGILLHRVLELWDGASSPDALLQRAAVECAADAGTVTRVRQRLASIARSPVLARITAAETMARELPIRFADDSGTVVERRIDRLIREHGREIVVDYKSGAASDARRAKDREQVAQYCRAIAAMTGRACEGVVWYVDTDEVLSV